MYKARKIALLAMFLVTLLGGLGCQRSELDGEKSITENNPATLTLDISKGNFSTVTTRANESENEIHSIALLVFNSKGKLITRSLYDVASTAQIRVNTYSGSNMRVVAVANYKSLPGLEEQLNTVSNYDVLNDVVITQSATSPANSAGILMTGETVADIIDSPSGTAISITMQYAVAKVNLTVKVPADKLPAGESLEIFNIALGSIATNGYLLSQSGEPEPRSYNQLTNVVFDGNLQEGLSATFYILENVRGGRQNIAPPTTIEETATNGHLFKRHFAPENSSFVVISAKHRRGGELAKQVDFYVYFGHNNSDDYNIRRSENHTYSIRISGLNNIDVDTNIETVEGAFDFGYGDNLTMDAHPDYRNLSFAKSSGTIDVEVLDNNGRRYSDAGFDASWVKISPLDLMKHQVRIQKGNGSKSEWQQSGNRDEIVRGKYIPHHSVREKLPNGNWNSIPNGTQNDDKLSFADATYRMCYAIGQIPLDKDREINIYADENLSGSRRSAKIEIRHTDNAGKQHIEVVTINQVPLNNLCAVDGRQMMVESFEEYSFNIYSSPAKQLAKKSGIDWGYYNNQLYSGANRAGEFLTANAVYGTSENSWVANHYPNVEQHNNGTVTWAAGATYRTKYGYTSQTSDWSSSLGTAALPYHYPDYNSTTQFYAPIYNSSAARYCHEKNRDLDGDGEISASETTWFLPSLSELKAISKYSANMPEEAKFELVYGSYYWSATEYDNQTANGVDFNKNVTGEYRKTVANRVRCVRRGEKSDQKDEVYVDGNNSVIVDNTGLDASLISTTPKTLFPASEASNKTMESRFVVARRDAVQNSSWTNAAGMTDVFIPLQLGDYLWSDKQSGCPVYSELSDGSDKGKWRLPTLNELTRISELRPQLEAVAGVTPMTDSWYWSVTEVPNVNVFNSLAVNPHSGSSTSFGRATLNNARCIRSI